MPLIQNSMFLQGHTFFRKSVGLALLPLEKESLQNLNKMMCKVLVWRNEQPGHRVSLLLLIRTRTDSHIWCSTLNNVSETESDMQVGENLMEARQERDEQASHIGMPGLERNLPDWSFTAVEVCGVE